MKLDALIEEPFKVMFRKRSEKGPAYQHSAVKQLSGKPDVIWSVFIEETPVTERIVIKSMSNFI